MSSFPPSRRALGGDGHTGSTVAPMITTTITTTPYPTSSPPPQPGAFFSAGGASGPLIAGFISIGAFAVAMISICAWRRFMGPTVTFVPDSVLRLLDRILPARCFGRRRRRLGRQFGEEGGGGGGGGGGGTGGRRRWRQQGRGERGRSTELRKAKPQMFDVWIERGRAVDTLNWEVESVPFSATLFTTARPPGPVETAAACMAEVSSRAGRYSVEEDEDDEEKRCRLPVRTREAAATGSSTLQVAVLLQMPSPQSHTVTEAQNDISVRGELAIGLVEAPWTREHPSSPEGTTAS